MIVAWSLNAHDLRHPIYSRLHRQVNLRRRRQIHPLPRTPLLPRLKRLSRRGTSCRRTRLAALKHLSDEQLDLMHTAPLDELKRRGRSVHGVETDLQTLRDRFETRPNFTKVRSRRTKKRQNVDIAEVVVTRGQINAVRAAFKAGITTSRIARQFGLSQSDVRKALASDEWTR